MKPLNSIFPLAASLALAACVSGPTIPDTLDPGPNETLAMVVPAKGVQIYECRAKKDASAFEWAFVAPDAELFDARQPDRPPRRRPLLAGQRRQPRRGHPEGTRRGAGSLLGGLNKSVDN